jgi:O-antigen ligase
LRWDLTITTGFSAKNLVIYLLATFIALRMVVGRGSVMAAGRMQAAFLVQIGYAIATWIVASLVIKYQGYDPVDTGIKLKSGLIDYYIFFLVFLFGVQTPQEVMKVIKWVLFGAVIANLATVLDSTGIHSFGFQERIDGRTQGAIGESNQYAAYIVLFIPGLIAAAISSRGIQRLAWLGGALISCAALAMTASRGGLVGLVVACAIGAYLYRHLISYSRIAGYAFAAIVVGVVLLSFSRYGGLLAERVFGDTGVVDTTEASSGRTEIWANMLYTMWQHPLTFLTGYGWDVYWAFAFRFSPHNHYLALWFNLGVIGLGTGCYLLFAAIGKTRRASLLAEPPLRGQLIAFTIGAIAVSAAVFFVDLHNPWVYYWMYAGLAVRLALCVEESPAPAPVPARVRRPASRPVPRDPYGWASTAGRR